MAHIDHQSDATEDADQKDPDTSILDAQVTRREALGLIATFAAAFANACKGKAPEQPIFGPQPSPTLPGNPDGKIPEVRKLEEPVTFPKPEGLEASQEEYLSACRSLVEQISSRLQMLATDFAQRPEKVKAQLASTIVMGIGDSILNTPLLQKNWESFTESWNQKDIYALVHEINKYLHAGGAHLHYKVGENYDTSVDFYPITGTSHMQISDSSTTAKVPVLNLGPGIFNPNEDVAAEKLGLATCTDDYSTVLYSPGRVPFTTKLLKRDPLLKDHIDTDFDQKIADDLLFHETMHIFLGQKFPKKGKERKATIAYEMKGDVPFDADARGEIGGIHHPIVLQELCAMGAEISRASTDRPVWILNFLNGKGLYQYILFQQLLQLAIMQVAPDSQLKRKGMRNFLSPNSLRQGEFDLEELRSIVTQPNFTKEHAHKVGQILYNTGTYFFEKLEKGAYKQISR
jgi:hypothetical protein